MNFRILGLDPAPFAPLFGLDDEQLSARGARRYVAHSRPGFPDRVELRDAEPGESLLLLNYTHQDSATPYRASHAIFVLEGAQAAYDRTGELPDCLCSRPVSLRAFDRDHMMIEAGLAAAGNGGRELERLIERFFANPAAQYLHAHYAAPGCYAARVERADQA